ncbi:hypothetical protein [Paenibacillus tengchongensis]|uniref:hypothetical protein n=1 Tax=Paenibacillus tengchongensis TaxID=2608684 RepID=UPI00124E97FE|nr:hypothetical protein [Paenibacillus tengchongensis]
MYSIILEAMDGEPLAKVHPQQQEQLLCQQSQHLGPLSELVAGQDCGFSSGEMELLLRELERLLGIICDVIACRHLRDLMLLALCCKEMQNGRLIFNWS